MTGETIRGTTSIQVTLTHIELSTLHRLQVYIPEIVKMIENGVFEFTNGQAVISRDHEGKLRKIEINQVRYRE